MYKRGFTEQDLKIVHDTFTDFCRQYEALYLHGDIRLIDRYPSSIHVLLHFAQYIAWLGPLPNYTQFTMERIIGLCGRLIHSNRLPYKDLARKIHDMEVLKMLHVSYLDLRTTQIRSRNAKGMHKSNLSTLHGTEENGRSDQDSTEVCFE